MGLREEWADETRAFECAERARTMIDAALSLRRTAHSNRRHGREAIFKRNIGDARHIIVLARAWSHIDADVLRRLRELAEYV